LDSDAPHRTAVFRVGPLRVRFASDDPQVTADLAALYAHLADRPTPSDAAAPITVASAATGRPLGPLTPTAWRRHTIACDGEPMFRRLSRNAVIPYMDWAVNWRLIDTADDLLLLHAGTVAIGDGAVLLAAASGSGKSTLTSALWAAGAALMSDEFGAIDPATRMLHPIPKPVCVKAGSFEPVSAMGLPIRTGRHYIKAFKGKVGYVTPADLPSRARGDAFADEAQTPRLVVFPQRVADHPTRVEPVSPAEAAFRLAGHAFNRHRHPDGGVPTLLELTRATPCVSITYAEATEAARAIGELVASSNASTARAAA
ncbi:MAG: hypothetical protein AAF078_14615, partial [Planctomycetota bacterium]